MVAGALGACSVKLEPQDPGGNRTPPEGAEPSTAPASLCVERKLVLENAAGERAESDFRRSGSWGGGLALEGADGSFVKTGTAGVLSDGATEYGPALFRASFGGAPPALYCANATSAVTSDGESTYRVSLRGASPLVDCEAGAPVEGSITICQSREGKLCPKSELSGTVDGQAITSSSSGYNQSGSTFSPHLEEAGIVEVELDGEAVKGAMVFLEKAPGASVLCATGGVVAQQGEGLRKEYRIELTGLRRLGACPLPAPADATTVEGCSGSWR